LALISSMVEYRPWKGSFSLLQKEQLLEELKERLQAYYLDEAYKICEKMRILKLILAYSHRKVGWNTPKFMVISYLSAEVKTNFGFGRVSYFYTRLQYKMVDIIPFSDWIIYENAQLFEIIRYSSKHPLRNESWLDAFEYMRDACNLAITDEIAFIRKYFIEECERMVIGLEEFLVGEEFKFLTMDKISTDFHKDGHNLIELRGEKLSGALDFIEKIILLTSIEIGVKEIEEFIDRIEFCNRTVKPMLVKEIELIEVELTQQSVELAILTPIYEELKKQHLEFEKLKNPIRSLLAKEKKFDYSKEPLKFNNEVERLLKEQKPEYEDFLKEYEPAKKSYQYLTAIILSLKTTKDNIRKYEQRIESYFLLHKDSTINILI